jgi:hypothetical protein
MAVKPDDPPVGRRRRTPQVGLELSRVQNANLISAQDKDFRFINDLFTRATNIITGAECTAWGLVGGVSGYCVAHLAMLGLLGSGVGVPLGFIAGVAIYTIANPTQKQLLNCLTRAKLTFASNLITKKEFEELRNQCFKAYNK